MHRRQFILSAPLAAAAGLAIQKAAAQVSLTEAPPAEALAAGRMRHSAAAFLASLTEQQRKSASFQLGAEQRTAWSNLPVGLVPRVGVSLGELDDNAKRHAHALIRSSTGSQGYLKMTAVMRHDEVLHDLESASLASAPAPSPGRRAVVDSMGARNYWLALFGDPIQHDNWGWLFTGHHIGATFTVAGSRVAFVPLFLGAAPTVIETGTYAGFQALSHEAIRGYELLRSLSPAQRTLAILSDKFTDDVVSGVGRQRSLARYEGIPASTLDPFQQRMLWALVEEYVRNADFEPAANQLDMIKTAGLDQLYFSWRGPRDDLGGRFYYRIHGPRIIIEYADQGGNHVHTITRDPSNDYGTDWLGLHYEEHSHN
jgi:hypothetical protein